MNDHQDPQLTDNDTGNTPDRQPFQTLFLRLPLDRVSTGTLQLGDWLEDECEIELPVDLRLGPDGQVWAQVGAVEDLPYRSLETRERLARQILMEFLEAYTGWYGEQAGNYPSPVTMRGWPIWQLNSWFYLTAPQTPDLMRALMNGVLGELQALGFRTGPTEPSPAFPASNHQESRT